MCLLLVESNFQISLLRDCFTISVHPYAAPMVRLAQQKHYRPLFKGTPTGPRICVTFRGQATQGKPKGQQDDSLWEKKVSFEGGRCLSGKFREGDGFVRINKKPLDQEHNSAQSVQHVMLRPASKSEQKVGVSF